MHRMKFASLFVILATLFLQIGNSHGGKATTKPIKLKVDARELPRKLVHCSMTIPVKTGKRTLYYPKWIPGKHSPAGPIADLAGVKITAGKTNILWKRDEVDGNALHCQIPEGVNEIQVEFDYLIASSGISRTAVSAKLAVIRWDQKLLYPTGIPADKLMIEPTLVLPKGWNFGGALKGKKTDNTVTFETVSLYTLIDSPMICGEYLKKIRLAPNTEPPHYLVMAGDSKHAIDLPDKLKEGYDRLVEETLKLFGGHPYRSYTFMLALSDHISHGGLEHHESSDNRLPELALHNPALVRTSSGLLPHEMVHAWNGKFRRPASMVTDDYQKPHRTKMLWVYEGLTSYLDIILTARCGLWTEEQTRLELACVADRMANHTGRKWRPLEDTTVGAHVLYTAKGSWRSWRRSLDYYDEGSLIWLEVDARIRKLSKGRKSLDDFCRLFFACKNGTVDVKGYTFKDLCASLNDVVEYDWEALLTRRVSLPAETAPLEGLIIAGWKLSYTSAPNEMRTARETYRKYIDLASSIGMKMTNDGKILDVIRGKAADKAGIGPGMKLLAVNSRRYTLALLKRAISESKNGGKLDLLIENEEFFRTHELNYKEGERNPTLERLSLGNEEMLGKMLAPLVK